MFGNDDSQQQPATGLPQVTPDASLTAEPVGSVVGAPAVQPSSTPVDDAASSYMMDSTGSSAPTPVPAGNDDLLTIKQQALQQLSPLLGHLDQSPEEKFRTTMMMIQASDNDSLISAAYEAAQAIPDEKARAQALLDVVNEINYFTQHQES